MNQKEIIERFYKAFQQLDAETMVSLYHDDIEFTDPGFGTLRGIDAKNMWRMLCHKAKDLKIETSNLTEKSVHWEAHYTFSVTGRYIHNIIDANFEFKEGKIIRHVDTFNLHKWASQAFGLKGLLLGGTSFFKKKLQKQAKNILEKFSKS